MRASGGHGDDPAPDRGEPSRRRELGIALALAAIGLLVVGLALRVDPGVQTDPLGPRVFPAAMGAGMALCGLLLGAGALADSRVGGPAPLFAESGGDHAPAGALSPGRLLAAVALTGAYIRLLEPVGYLLATPPYVAGIMLIHGGPAWRRHVLPPLLLTAALYAAFRFGLLIPVPDGLLERWLPW